MLVPTYRRQLLTAFAAALCGPYTLRHAVLPALAAEGAAVSQLSDATFGYQLSYPIGWEAAPKPVKTHLMESIVKGSLHKAQLGLTVDPVKIGSLEEFGTIEQARRRGSQLVSCVSALSRPPLATPSR